MADFFRETSFGVLVRIITRKRCFSYPEENRGLQFSIEQRDLLNLDSILDVQYDGSERTSTFQDCEVQIRHSSNKRKQIKSSHGDKIETVLGGDFEKTDQPNNSNVTHLQGGAIIIGYNSASDPANPRNWSVSKKYFITAILCLYHFAAYMGSSIYTTSEKGVASAFSVSLEVAELGLALFVLGYAIGALIWSPLSEWPNIGRTPPYIYTLGIFVVLSVPTALVQNVAGLLILRFLLGIFSSPALATVPASLGDMFTTTESPYIISLWTFVGLCGPALGPLVSGFAVTAEGWRWSFWEELWLTGFTWLLLFCFVPETYTPTILLGRAKRMRVATGDGRVMSQSEFDREGMNIESTAYDVLIKPIQLNIYDPSIAFISIYCSLIYSIYYSFFECFPFVYGDMYHWNTGQQGLAFIAIAVGALLALILYWVYYYRIINPRISQTQSLGAPEDRLLPAIIGSVMLPIGLFIFGWTANPRFHWIGTIIGIATFMAGFFLVMQSLFVYLSMSYPRYTASVFAGNNLGRSSGAVGTIQYSRYMFQGLGVGPGISLLAGLCVLCIAGVVILHRFGANLRARSRFTERD